MKKIIGLIIGLILLTGCSNIAIVSSGSSLALSNNAYAKAYKGMDVLTIMYSEKSIKKHIYDKGKEHVQTLTRIVNDKNQ